MRNAGWHILREGDDRLTLARQLPPRFDIVAQARLPHGSATRYAHQIRQDMWRALQNVRGFSPVVRLTRVGSGWIVEAGGRASRPTQALAERVHDLIETAQLRQRWIRHAQQRKLG